MTEWRGILRSVGVAAVVVGLAGCGGRMPEGTRTALSDPPAADAALAAAGARLTSLIAAREAERRGPAATPPGLLAAAAAVDGGRLAPVAATPGTRHLSTRWRQAELRLPLDSRPPLGAPVVQFPGVQAAETVVHLDAMGGQVLAVTARCDGPMGVADATGPRPNAPASTPARLTVGPTPYDGSQLRLGPDVTACDLTVQGPGAPHSLRLERDEGAAPALAALDTRLDVCAVPPAGTLDPLARAALADRWLSRTCLADPGAMRLLTDGIAAFNAKAEALTGRALDPGALAVGDPGMPLDFSAAPELELIVVSALQLRADFTGRMLGRMLAHHAARGTPVRILVSRNLATGPDRRMLARLAADWPAVQVQTFRWQPPRGLTPASLPDRIQRGHHVKAFGVLGRDPAASRFMVGGRNLHDGFVFDTPRDLSGQPGLHDYTSLLRPPLAYFAAYEDLELELSGPGAVRAMMAHMGTLWHRDAPSAVIRPFSVSAEVPGAAQTGAFHFLSVPQADGRALERWLVELFDAAEARIDIATPYLNLTPALDAALVRALDRGVAVRLVIPRIVQGDFLGGLKDALKRDFLRRYGNRIEIWQVAQPERILHSKFLIFDGRLSLVTSANLNARSLMHDTENGVALLDQGFAARLAAVQDSYVARGERVRDAAPPGPAGRLLLRIDWIRSWF